MIEQKDTLLYFLATVPQVLGAFLALTGVFFVLSIDAMKKKVFSFTQQLIDNYSNDNWRNMLFSELNDREINRKLKDNVGRIKYYQVGDDLHNLRFNANNIFKITKEKLDTTGNEDSKVNDIYSMSAAIINWVDIIIHNKKVTVNLFIINGIIIFLFISGFYFVPRIVCNKVLYQIIIITGILLAGFSLYTIINFIINILKERREFKLISWIWLQFQWIKFRNSYEEKRSKRKNIKD